ncbi:hypothetical protein N7509_013364 [Penicillium cosmopolitanum]|uniref:F-box domain-containing protein n=1 Tax=Penicillium cosmopolitanum TaxID=1131564 RepID=A0A9W9VBY3_9EURO|nr:uncharacterized protein N7509_013364 [Penicillium cosmopolitanum]KAJ5376478.1 hypothetical protein N7509_013364 [Penicillium cosmopolitanum]
MSLSQLPTEILWIISSYLLRQNDIYGLVRTNRRLYRELIKSLHYWNAQYDHGSAFPVAAEYNLLPQLRNILVGLDLARTKSHSPPQPGTHVPHLTRCQGNLGVVKRDRGRKEEERRSDPYWEDIYTHPLLSRGYCFTNIINIQHALAIGIKAGHEEVVQALLDFGAEVNFYRGSHTANPLPSDYTSIRWHSQEVDIDNPPLFIAVQYGHTEMVSKLLECGADPQRYTPSPLYRAVEDDHRDIVSVLLKRNLRSQKSALKLATLRGNYLMVEFLLCNGLNASEYGNASLHAAEMKGYKNIANLLKLHGATIDTLSDGDRENWEAEDRDGTDRPIGYGWCSGAPEEGYPDDSSKSESESINSM